MTTKIRIGLPYGGKGPLLEMARALNAPILLSAGSLWRKETGFTPMPRMAWGCDVALDSAGFTAMQQGGYRWSVSEYVAFVVTNRGDGSMPFPWAWWSAMDFCCEPEIATNRAEVERRIDLTISTYAETMAELEAWREEGDTETPDPMPILQGRTPADYVRCARELAAVCRDGELPARVGVGSVCRRELHGPEGLLEVLQALHEELPAHVRLHLFGVKGALLAKLARFEGRIESVDSMAWDTRARNRARHEGIPYTVENRAEELKRWYTTQRATLVDAPVAPVVTRQKPNQQPVQLSLF